MQEEYNKVTSSMTLPQTPPPTLFRPKRNMMNPDSDDEVLEPTDLYFEDVIELTPTPKRSKGIRYLPTLGENVVIDIEA